MKLADAIDESVLSDARKVDDYARKQGSSLPSVEKTLRIIRDIDPDALRKVAKDVWGTGGSDGKDLVGNSFNECITELDTASRNAAGWTGEAKNAYSERVTQTKSAINGMRKPSRDVGQALENIADVWDEAWGSTTAKVISLIGVVVAIIGVVLAVPTGGISLIASIVGLLASAAAIVWSEKQKEHNRVEALESATADAKQTMKSANKAEP